MSKHDWSWSVHCDWCREVTCHNCGTRIHEYKATEYGCEGEEASELDNWNLTTEELRADFCWDSFNDEHDAGLEPIFDRWLELFGKSEQLAERERIIKLLTDAGHEWHVEMECAVCEAGYCHCDSIQLIKGEEA